MYYENILRGCNDEHSYMCTLKTSFPRKILLYNYFQEMVSLICDNRGGGQEDGFGC